MLLVVATRYGGCLGGDALVTQSTADEVVELTAEEDREILEREARRLLNLSADEFARRWDAGEYKHDSDPKVTQVAMLLPHAR